MQTVRFSITTDASGAFTETIDARSPKLLYSVEWTDGTLADGVDAVLSVTDTVGGADLTLLTLTNANDDAVYYPRTLEHNNGGTALTTYGLPLVAGSLKLVVSGGGSVATGVCNCYLFEV